MKDISITTNSLWVCSSYYEKISEHLKVMNSWKNNPEYVDRFPYLFEKEFTMQDSLNDLLMKGGL